jgi:predicted dinucleotide-binding enzyme
MTTAIIGVGNIGKSVARQLVDGGERVVLAASDESNATAPGRSSVGTPSADLKRRARIGQRLTVVRTSLRARSPATLMAP